MGRGIFNINELCAACSFGIALGYLSMGSFDGFAVNFFSCGLNVFLGAIQRRLVA